MTTLEVFVKETVKAIEKTAQGTDFSQGMSLVQAIGYAWEAVQEKGEDYVYINPDGEKANGFVHCMNWDESRNQPSCIVGHILYAAGIGPSLLIKNNTMSPWSFGEQLSPKAVEFTALLQGYQDVGDPWGKALKKALSDAIITTLIGGLK